MFPLLPFESTQRCIAIAMAEVIEKRNKGKRVAELPYATAFFRSFFGTSTPSRAKLYVVCDSLDMTIIEIKMELDRFIESNGRSYTSLNKTFKEQAFPCLAGLERFEAHFELKQTQNSNVKIKAENNHKELLNKLRVSILELSPRELTSWVSDTEDQISNLEQISILAHWHKKKANDDLPFHDLYFDFGSAMEIAVDLSYI